MLFTTQSLIIQIQIQLMQFMLNSKSISTCFRNPYHNDTQIIDIFPHLHHSLFENGRTSCLRQEELRQQYQKDCTGTVCQYLKYHTEDI